MSSAQDFTIEAWTYLGVDLLLVLLRLLARWKTVGLRGLAVDDFLMVIAVLLYTAETATAHYVGAYWQGMANSGMTDAQRATLDPASLEYYLRVKGSQTQLFGWLVYTCLLWTLKTCWLFFYKRLGDGVQQMTLMIRIGFVFTAITFVATFFTILCGCWPIEKHWQINPDPGNHCQPAVSRLQAYTLICTNLATDFYIMTIPLPMIWNARMSPTKKIGLVVMFSGGIITAIFGGLRCGFILQDSPEGPQLAGEWSCRESFVAVLISNIPVLFPLALQGFKHIKDATTKSSSRGNSKGSSLSYKLTSLVTIGAKDKKDRGRFRHPLSLPDETRYARATSEEDILDPEQGQQNLWQDAQPNVQGEINVKKEWQIQTRNMTVAEAETQKRSIVSGFAREES